MPNLSQIKILPRLIRLKDASFYLGMDKNRFNCEVRKELTEIPIGKQGIAFDRLELDAWVEQQKQNCGKSLKQTPIKQPEIPIQRLENVQKKTRKGGCLSYQQEYEAFEKAIAAVQTK